MLRAMDQNPQMEQKHATMPCQAARPTCCSLKRPATVILLVSSPKFPFARQSDTQWSPFSNPSTKVMIGSTVQQQRATATAALTAVWHTVTSLWLSLTSVMMGSTGCIHMCPAANSTSFVSSSAHARERRTAGLQLPRVPMHCCRPDRPC